MRVFNISMLALIALGVSVVASAAVITIVWRRHDPLILKVATTLVALVPVVGPLVALWVLSFPDPMHPDLQAKEKRTVNQYSIPREAIREKLRQDKVGRQTSG